MNNETDGQLGAPARPEISERASGQDKLVIILAVSAVAFVLVLAYILYALFQRVNQPATTMAPIVSPTVTLSPTVSEEQQAEEEIEKLETVSLSDEIEVLEKDIESSNFSTLDSDLNLIEQEL